MRVVKVQRNIGVKNVSSALLYPLSGIFISNSLIISFKIVSRLRFCLMNAGFNCATEVRSGFAIVYWLKTQSHIIVQAIL